MGKNNNNRNNNGNNNNSGNNNNNGNGNNQNRNRKSGNGPKITQGQLVGALRALLGAEALNVQVPEGELTFKVDVNAPKSKAVANSQGPTKASNGPVKGTTMSDPDAYIRSITGKTVVTSFNAGWQAAATVIFKGPNCRAADANPSSVAIRRAAGWTLADQRYVPIAQATGPAQGAKATVMVDPWNKGSGRSPYAVAIPGVLSPFVIGAVVRNNVTFLVTLVPDRADIEGMPWAGDVVDGKAVPLTVMMFIDPVNANRDYILDNAPRQSSMKLNFNWASTFMKVKNDDPASVSHVATSIKCSFDVPMSDQLTRDSEENLTEIGSRLVSAHLMSAFSQ